jgi:propionate catabolism operon transcriptional regulator
VAVLYSHRAAEPAPAADELSAVLPELFQTPDEPRAGDLRSARGAEEAAVIERVVAECGGNMSEAAKRLGVGRSTLYRKLRARG